MCKTLIVYCTLVVCMQLLCTSWLCLMSVAMIMLILIRVEFNMHIHNSEALLKQSCYYVLCFFSFNGLMYKCLN